MKFHAIQRSVKPQRYGRAAGDAPAIGHVERMPGKGWLRRAQRKRRRGGKRHSSRRGTERGRKVIAAWSMLLAAVAAVLIASAVWFWIRPTLAVSPASAGNSAMAGARQIAWVTPPSQEEAVEMVKQALTMRQPGQVAGVFRLGEARAEEVVAFLAKYEEDDGRPVGYEWHSSLDANDLAIEGVVVTTEKTLGEPRYRLVLLTPDEHQRWKIDFDAFARVVKPSWAEIQATASIDALVRVVVVPDTYFNGPYHDEDVWSCYALANPDTEETMMGYCRRGTPQAKAIAKLMTSKDPKEPTLRMTLTIHHQPEAGARQFEITRVLAEDWILTATPYDQSFE